MGGGWIGGCVFGLAEGGTWDFWEERRANERTKRTGQGGFG
jgi:hypothetical protein